MNLSFQLFQQFCADHSLAISSISISLESKEYDACTFVLNSKKIIFRSAKITPTKIGQFVTIWQRNNTGITCPFAEHDNFNYIIINCVQGNHVGQFIFPKSVLIEQGIVTTKNKEGKRGIRVYPSWDNPINAQAIKTQAWQTNYFVMMSNAPNYKKEDLKKYFL